MRCILFSILISGFAMHAALAPAAEQSKPAAPARIFKNTGKGAQVLASTFVGGPGHEWLCGGGFAPDGTVVLVGNVIGPEFELNTPVRVIGTDLTPPPAAQRVPVLDKGKPKIGKDGKAEFEKPSWRHPGVTAFIVRFSPDLKKMISVSRFPWAAGAATAAAVDANGDIYVAGKASDQIGSLGKDVAELPAIAEDGKSQPRCEHAFIARFTPDGTTAKWIRHVRGPCAAPTVNIAPDGNIHFGAGNTLTIDPAGKLVGTTTIPGGARSTASVNPKDGTIAVGGEHHWPTGREPWRCSTLSIYQPDGALKYPFYDWGGPYVGLNNCRQVSDSAIRLVTHDPDGKILFYAWSDGGNSVMTTEPFDVRSPVVPKGTGMNAAGAGVLSCAYLIDLDPADYHVRAWTFWSANAQNGRPNSIWVQSMARIPGGALAVAGNGAWGIWQTADKLSDAEPTGDYVAIFSNDFSQLRYCSVIPGAGVAEIGDGAAGRGGQWAIAAGTVNGKSRLLFVGSAEEGRTEAGKTIATPIRNGAQEKFGGGWCDGYALLLELPEPAKSPVAPEVKPSPHGRATFEQLAKGKDPKKARRMPEEGAVFHFLPTFPKYVTADVEIRTHDESKWPDFLYGKPVNGSFTYHANGPEANFTVLCDALCQPMGSQERRVIGEWVVNPKTPPAVRFSLESLSAAKTADVKYVDRGTEKTRTAEYFDGKGWLEMGGNKISVSPRVTISFSGPKNQAIEDVYITAFMTLSASDLGLKNPAAATPIDLRVSMSGSARSQAPPKDKK